jgi:crossover junction endodeoxyribonuclease RuvC
MVRKEKEAKIIAGVDPGTNVLGYAVVECRGRTINLLSMGVIQLDKYDNPYDKLKRIYEGVHRLVQSYKPQEFAVEAPFYGKNVQSMLKLGRAQGVAIAAAAVNNIPVTEYSPKKVKQSITGNGNATKEQVSAMLLNILNIELQPKFFDATDALAVAVCHSYQNIPVTKSKKTTAGKGSSWSKFVDANPERVMTKK